MIPSNILIFSVQFLDYFKSVYVFNAIISPYSNNARWDEIIKDIVAFSIIAVP